MEELKLFVRNEMYIDEVGFWEFIKDEYLNICIFVNKGYGEIWEWEILNIEYR